jgi:hypothetical protein
MGETAATARADDYQVGVLRGIDEFLDHKAVHSMDSYRGGPGIAQLAGRLLRHFLSGVPQVLEQGHVPRADHRDAPPVALSDLMHCEYSQRGMHRRCLSHRPVKRPFRVR